MNTQKITAFVITHNEEKNIEGCLGSISWSDEIVIVDSMSTDRTLDIAKKYTKNIYQKEFTNFSEMKNFALSKATNHWVLSLDADERMSVEIKEEIQSMILHNPQYSAYTIPRRNYIGTYWVKGGGWYPSAQMKLFRKDKFRFEEVEVHPRAFLDGSCGHLKGDMIHYSYKGYEDFLNKINKQTTLEAKKWVRTGRKMSLGVALWRAIDRFFRRFIGKKGWKDGFIGFMVAFFDTLYQIVSYAKYRQMVSENDKKGNA